MTSGASMIFSTPEGQWTQVLERLNIPVRSDDFCEMIVSKSNHYLLSFTFLVISVLLDPKTRLTWPSGPALSSKFMHSISTL